MSEELVILGHNDLDQLGCELNIEFKFPNVKKKYFRTNYSNIPEIVDSIEEHIKKNGNKHILIVDVSFSDNKESLKRLYSLAKCTIIDHHMYPDGFWDEFPYMKVVHDKSKSATLLCNEYFGNKGKNANLDKLSYIIDVYDLWQTKNIAFDFAQDFNEYFWRYDIALLRDNLIANNFKLLNDFTETVTSIKNEYNSAIKQYEDTGKIQRAGVISIAFLNDWFNQVNIQEMNNGKHFVIGFNSYGITRIRVNGDAGYSEEKLNALRFELTGNAEYGHLHAFTYKVDKANIMSEAQRIVNAINKVILNV